MLLDGDTLSDSTTGFIGGTGYLKIASTSIKQQSQRLSTNDTLFRPFMDALKKDKKREEVKRKKRKQQYHLTK